MAKSVVLDELHITIRIASTMPDEQVEELRRTLNGEDFMNRLRRTVRNVVRSYPELNDVRVSLTR